MGTADKRQDASDPGIEPQRRVSTGAAGLDDILHGGLLPQRCYLLRGGPGLGKTTLGLKFLTAGDDGETSLFIGFQETTRELKANAHSVGIDLTGIEFLSLSATEDFFTQAGAYDVFGASDVEQTPMIEAIVEAVERIQPTRIFIDSMTELRFVSADLTQFRKQVKAFLRFVTDRGATVIFTSESTQEMPDDDLQFISDGIIELEHRSSSGVLSIRKFRGSGFRRGKHQFRVDNDGFTIYSQVLPPPQRFGETAWRQLISGNVELDAMLQGGIEAGTVTLLAGPTGIGKSTLGGLFAVETARSGHNAVVYQFEEELDGWKTRLRALEVEVDAPHRDGRLTLAQIEPLHYLADEFTNDVRAFVEANDVELVIIDSITGFNMLLGAEESNRPLHALVKTLTRLGVAIILINENRAIVGAAQITESDFSYIADNVIYLRYLETETGTMHKRIGVLKKRLSGFDNRQRRFEIGPVGIDISDHDQDREADSGSAAGRVRT